MVQTADIVSGLPNVGGASSGLSNNTRSMNTRARIKDHQIRVRDNPDTTCDPETCACAGQGTGIYSGDDGYLYCDSLRVEDCRQQHLAALTAAGQPQQPAYLYSKNKLTANFTAYREAMGDLPHIIGYAVKANNNLSMMKHLRELGSGAVLVSGNELKLAMQAGFDTTKCVPVSLAWQTMS